MRRLPKNPTASKALTLIVIVFILKTLAGCRPRIIPFSFDSMRIEGIDNSGRHWDNHPTDTLKRDAVAIRIILYSSNDDDTAFWKKVNELLVFEPAYAVIDVFPRYVPVSKVESIHIKTLFDIDNNIRAGDDITSYFLYYTGNPEDLYYPLDEVLGTFNCEKNKSFPIFGSSALLVLTKSVRNTKAQFEVRVGLENGEEITGTSPLFTIL